MKKKFDVAIMKIYERVSAKINFWKLAYWNTKN